MNLFLADISSQKKQIKLEDLFIGEEFPNSSILKEMDINFSFYSADDSVMMKFSGEFSVQTKCARCEDEIIVTIEINEDICCLPEEKGMDSAEWTYSKSKDFIEIDPILHELFVFNTPTKILCDEDCKGKCPVCGANLNYEKCECKKDNFETITV
jgi:uncharacterized protein